MAWLMKGVENRGWAPPHAVCGQLLAIHAGKTVETDAFKATAGLTGTVPEGADDATLGMTSAEISALVRRRVGRLSPGAVSSVGILAGYVCDDGHGHVAPGTIAIDASGRRIEDPDELMRKALRSNFYVGPIGWIVVNRLALPRPVECTGRQGLWALPTDVERRVIDQVHEAGPRPAAEGRP
jgi:hypothetical protein